jgi:hypothetical protein
VAVLAWPYKQVSPISISNACMRTSTSLHHHVDHGVLAYLLAGDEKSGKNVACCVVEMQYAGM